MAFYAVIDFAHISLVDPVYSSFQRKADSDENWFWLVLLTWSAPAVDNRPRVAIQGFALRQIRNGLIGVPRHHWRSGPRR